MSILSDQINEQLEKEKAQAEIDYKKILVKNKKKTYMDLLPKEFSTSKRSLINRIILDTIDDVEKKINDSKLYKKIITKKDIVQYMLSDGLFLKEKFIPRLNDMSIWMKLFKAEKKEDTEKQKQKLADEFYENNKDEFKRYSDMNYHVQSLKQVWDSYKDRQNVKKGKLVHSWDMEKNGFPSTSRGALCYLYIPVKGKFPKNAKGSIKLYNPRKKKIELFTDLKYNSEDETYACISPNGKKVFLTNYKNVEDAYSDLFDINKAIYSGWWNKVMEIK